MFVVFGFLAIFLGFKLPPYGMAAIVLLVLYTIVSEIRFGSKARAMKGGVSDRGSTIAVSVATTLVGLGFIATMHTPLVSQFVQMPDWLLWPGPAQGRDDIAWTGIVLGLWGVVLRLWAVLKLRQRYTRTLLIQDQHAVE